MYIYIYMYLFIRIHTHRTGVIIRTFRRSWPNCPRLQSWGYGILKVFFSNGSTWPWRMVVAQLWTGCVAYPKIHHSKFANC